MVLEGGTKFVLGSRREELRYNTPIVYLLSLVNETLPVGTVICIIILLRSRCWSVYDAFVR